MNEGKWIKVSDMGGLWWGVYVQQEDNKFYWIFSTLEETRQEEIPESLYIELLNLRKQRIKEEDL